MQPILRTTTCLILFCGATLTAAAAQTSTQTATQPTGARDAAVAAIVHLGGRVGFDRDDNAYRVLLEGEAFTDAAMSHVAALRDVATVQIVRTSVTDAAFEQLKDLDGLTTIEFQRARAPGRITDAGLAHLSGVTQLKTLHLRNAEVTDAGLEHVAPLTNLQTLILAGSKATDAGLPHIKGLTKLEQLDLYDTTVSDAGLEQLKGLTSLKLLILKRTNVTDAGVARLQAALPGCTISHSPRD
jgi:hypothetical protein